MNLKNERILKLHRAGLSSEQIAKRLGLPNTDRVTQGLEWLKGEKRLEDGREAVSDDVRVLVPPTGGQD